MRIFTIGHSTRSLGEFIDILKNFNIELVIDVRRFPSSKKFPWFNKESLEKELRKCNICYIHFPELGGYRKEGYEAFSKSKEFKTAIEKLLEIVDDKTAAILCAELFFGYCHRKYIANYLSNIGHRLIHIFDKEKTQEHKLKSSEMEEKMKLVIYCDKRAKNLEAKRLKKSLPV